MSNLERWNIILGLILGVLGAITGTISLILYFLKFRKERPILKITQTEEGYHEHVREEVYDGEGTVVRIPLK